MHLISSLIAGIAGAEGGTVDLYQRGTTTAVTHYTDFEGTASATGQVTLDAKGRAELYVNQLVRVLVKDSTGATVVDFVDGAAAPNVEVRSDSFTGTPYGGGGSAAGEPTTLKAIADAWFTSAGAIDFKVLYDGVATTLQSAISKLTGQRVFPVTEYGAKGDGVSNDTTAINSAISAANTAGGGVVYFPAGTYLVNTITCFSTVAIQGAGRKQTTIKLATNTNFISGTLPSAVSDMKFTFSVSTTAHLIAQTAATSGDVTEIRRVDVADMSGICLSLQSSVANTVRVSDSTMSSSNTVMSAGANAQLEVSSCSITKSSTSGSTHGLLAASSSTVYVTNCSIDFSACTSGTAAGVTGNTGSSVFVSGCDFIRPDVAVTSWHCMSSTGALVEFGNSVQSTLDNYSANYAAYFISGATSVLLGTRDMLSIEPEDPNADPLVIPADQAGCVFVENDSSAAHSANVGIDLESAGHPYSAVGARLVLVIRNTTGASVTYAWGTKFTSSTVTFAVANGLVRSFLLVCVDEGGTKRWAPVADLAGAET